jgi:hypothetical protein
MLYSTVNANGVKINEKDVEIKLKGTAPREKGVRLWPRSRFGNRFKNVKIARLNVTILQTGGLSM